MSSGGLQSETRARLTLLLSQSLCSVQPVHICGIPSQWSRRPACHPASTVILSLEPLTVDIQALLAHLWGWVVNFLQREPGALQQLPSRRCGHTLSWWLLSILVCFWGYTERAPSLLEQPQRFEAACSIQPSCPSTHTHTHMHTRARPPHASDCPLSVHFCCQGGAWPEQSGTNVSLVRAPNLLLL